MACLHQPECNFLYGFFRCKLPVEVVDVEVKITSMQGRNIFRRDRMTQLIKCTPWSMRLHLHPTIIKKWRPFWRWKVRWDQFQFQHLVTNSGLHSQTLIPVLGRMMLQKREREPHLRSSDQQPPNLPQCAFPYQWFHQGPRIAHPYLQYQWEKTPHGLAQAKCWETFLRTNWLLPKKLFDHWNKSENATSITSPKPSLKEELKIGEQSIISQKQRNADGDQIVLSAKSGQGKLGWQTSKSVTARKHHPAKSAKAPSKMPPKLTKAWSRGTDWQVSKPDKNSPTMGSRNGEDWTLNII